jgi:sporulation protein YlmC with PRC-barrel domain
MLRHPARITHSIALRTDAAECRTRHGPTMSTQALRPTLRRIKRRPLLHRQRRSVAVEGELLSVAGVVGAPVYGASGDRLASLEDLVISSDSGGPHPPLVGAVIRTHRKRAFLPASAIADLKADRLRLRGNFAPQLLERKPGLVALAHDVLDRQIVDVDGADIVRVSDLVLGRFPDGFRLVGADVSVRTLLRRLGPPSMRRNVAAERVYDWASVAAFSVRGAGEAGSVLRLTNAAAQLGTLRPDELEGLLGDLPSHERVQFAEHLAANPA